MDLFQSCGHCWVFQICWHVECSTFTASSFRIWNSSTGHPSCPLVLFLVMLPKAHLTSHSRMSGSRWVITHHDYLGYEDLFCTVLLCILATRSKYLLLLLGPYPFCPLSSPSLHEIVPLVSLIFLKRSLVFLILLFSSIFCTDCLEKLSYLFLLLFETVHSDAYIFPFILCFSLLFLSQLFVRPPKTAILLFCISFPWRWSWGLSPVQCHEPLSVVHQALCLSDLVH